MKNSTGWILPRYKLFQERDSWGDLEWSVEANALVRLGMGTIPNDQPYIPQGLTHQVTYNRAGKDGEH